MQWMLNRTRFAWIVMAMMVVPLATGCDLFGDDDDDDSERISLSQLETELGGATRVEIQFLSDGLVAREVTVDLDESDDDDNEEEIESEVSGIDPQAGTLELVLGDLTVSYNDQSRFRTENDSNVPRSEWEQAVLDALDNGRVFIEARREVPASPQAPGNATFSATDLRLEDDIDRPSIEIWVDADNFERMDDPPPLAILRVLGLDVEINNDTRLRLDDDDDNVSVTQEFEGTVTAVDLDDQTLTLANGTIVHVENATFDTDGDLLTLVATIEALDAGDRVRAEGRGTVITAGPPREIDARTIEVEIDN